MSQAQRKLTVEDYELFPEGDGKRHELIDGEHVVTAAPFIPHQQFLGELFIAVHRFVREHDLGMALFAPVDVELSRHDVLQPDMLFVSKQRMHIVSRRRFHAAPDLAVEVLSASTRRLDEIRKRARYEQFDVQELWLVDLSIDGMRIYRRTAPGEPFGPALQLLSPTDTLVSPLLPGFSLPLRDLFAVTKGLPDDALEGS